MKKLLLLIPLLCGCSGEKVSTTTEPELTMIDYVNITIATTFSLTYNDREIVILETHEINTFADYEYYLTDLYYVIEFDNNLYETKYLSGVNSQNELVVKEVKQ